MVVDGEKGLLSHQDTATNDMILYDIGLVLYCQFTLKFVLRQQQPCMQHITYIQTFDTREQKQDRFTYIRII